MITYKDKEFKDLYALRYYLIKIPMTYYDGVFSLEDEERTTSGPVDFKKLRNHLIDSIVKHATSFSFKLNYELFTGTKEEIKDEVRGKIMASDVIITGTGAEVFGEKLEYGKITESLYILRKRLGEEIDKL